MRQIPHNPEAEQAFIATLAVNPDKIPVMRLKLQPEDFYMAKARLIYSALLDIDNQDIQPSLPILAEKLSGKMETADIMKFMNSVQTPSDLEPLAEVIKEHSRRRAIIRLADKLLSQVTDEEAASEIIISQAQDGLMDIMRNEIAEWKTNSQLIAEHLELIEERYKTGGVRGISTGFLDLDEKLGGFFPGQLIFLGAVPKMGKTSFALHVAMNCKVPTLFFTLEMLPEELADRQFAVKSKIDVKQLRGGKIGDREWEKISMASADLGELPIGWVWRSGLTVAEMKAIARQYQAEHGLGLIVIDQLDKIGDPPKRGETETNRIGRVTRQLKNMARDLGVPVLCLVQLLDKAVSARSDPRPAHGDVRDSSYPDQDCDVMLYLWRPEFYKQDERLKNIAEIIVARSRGTETGSVWVRWVPQFTMFELLERACWPEDIDEIMKGEKKGAASRKAGGSKAQWPKQVARL